MFLLLPLIGGFVAGLLAPRRIAIPITAVLFAIGATFFILSAPDHDATYVSSALVCVAVALVTAGTAALGLWLRSRRTARA